MLTFDPSDWKQLYIYLSMVGYKYAGFSISKSVLGKIVAHYYLFTITKEDVQPKPQLQPGVNQVSQVQGWLWLWLWLW